MKVVLSGKYRPLSTYIAGNPGMGKSSLIQRMALADITAGRGVCVIDPTGDLVNRLIHWIPKKRVEDTILFDTDDPIPIDFFSYRNPPERQVLADQLLNLFDLEAAPISRPRLQRIIGTLFDANENGGNCTFLDIQHFIESPKRRAEILDRAPHRKAQWDPFPKPSDTVSIVERMTPYTEAPTLRKIFSDPHPPLNIWDLMQSKKVLLVNLKDTPTDLFIGSLITAKIQQATFGRRYISEAKRTPYYLYIDECHTIMQYAAPQFEAILTRARKYKLCLILANQLPSDLPKEIQAKLPTIATRIDFIAPFFAQYVDPDHPPIPLESGDFAYTTIKTPSFLGASPASYAQVIRKRTVDNYASTAPKKVVELEDDDEGPTLLPDQAQAHDT
jgi:hypothetical protein